MQTFIAMDYENSFNGSVDWSFPSPGATPTSTSFNHDVFQTPKSAAYPSHFQDAFSTPHMRTFATPGPNGFNAVTPVQRQPSSSETLRSNYYANVQASGVQGMLAQNHAGVPVHGNEQLQSSPTFQGHVPPTTALSFDSVQMQTPPPTRDPSVKKPQAGNLIAFGTPSTIASRRFMSPQQAFQQVQQSPASHQIPVQYPHLQFSPNAYQFGNLGPASAPAMPQAQLLWEQASSPNLFAPHTTMLHDPFTRATTATMEWPVAPLHQGLAQAVAFDTPAMDSFPVQPPHPRPASAAPALTALHESSELVPTSVDPSLVYSSPIRPPMPSKDRSNKVRGSQLQLDTKRKDSAVVDHARSDTVSSASSMDTLTSSRGLRRSNTTGNPRPRSVHSAAGGELLNRSNSFMQVPRTASPLKRSSQSFLGSISESRKPRSRASVVLTVDENGIARTETTHVDGSPTRSMREKYPQLFESDSSDAESDASDRSPSRSRSFSMLKNEARKIKAARLDPPIENLEGLSIPRSSSSASMRVTPSRAAIAAAAQLRRGGGSLRKKTPSRTGQRRPGNSSMIDTCPMDSADHCQYSGADDPSGSDLSHNLHSRDWSGSMLDAHNRRWSMMSSEQQHPRPQSISPTHQFPNSRSAPNAQQTVSLPRQIRCTCGVPGDQGQPLIRCTSCTQWSHAACIGLPANLAHNSFTCFLCTKPMQTRRMR